MAEYKEYKDKESKDLEKELLAKRKSLQEFRFGMAGSKTKNVKEGSNLKKDIAKILTVLRAK